MQSDHRQISVLSSMRHLLLLVVVASISRYWIRCVSADVVGDGAYPSLESAFVDVRVTKGQDGDRASALKKYLNLIDEKMSTAGILRFGRSLRSGAGPAVQLWTKQADTEDIELYHKLSTIPALGSRQDYMRILLHDRRDRRSATTKL